MKLNKSIAIICALSATTVYAINVSYYQNPALNLVSGGNNLFYGIVNNDGTGTSGSGAVYSWNASSNTYAAVTANIPDPIGAPLVAKDGSIYQLSYQGGVNNQGALYHIVNGVATIVYAFTSASDGTHPNTIVMVPDGRIFGTTYDGG
ncbi:MAG: hypothetical protein RL017_827, partial [Pseudomonadota bacterium]